MATGGGGGVEVGTGVLKGALADGIQVEWVDAADIPDEVWAVTPFAMGSIAPQSQEVLAEIAQGVGIVSNRVRAQSSIRSPLLWL
jgi:hypothetical protein